MDWMDLLEKDNPNSMIVDASGNLKETRLDDWDHENCPLEVGDSFVEALTHCLSIEDRRTIQSVLSSGEQNILRCTLLGGRPLRILFVPLPEGCMHLFARVEDNRKALEDQLREEMEVRQNTEKQLLLAQRYELVGQIAAGVAHEINTPLQFVWNNLDFVNVIVNQHFGVDSREGQSKQDDKRIREEVPEAIHDSFEGLKRIRRIIRLVVEYAKPGRRAHVPLDVNNILQDAIDFTRPTWRFVANMETRTDASIPVYTASAEDLSQALVNLIVNAAEAIEERYGEQHPIVGKIICTTSLDSEYITIQVTDNGGGIPAQLHKRIFAPFFTTKTSKKAAGMGLAMVYAGIVNQHRGIVSVDCSSAESTTFTLQLPIEAREDLGEESNP